MKKWIVTAVDHRTTCDGKARILKVCNTKTEAERYVKADMEEWLENNKDEGAEIDFNKMSAHFDYDQDDGCEWNVEEIEIP